jgi:hypothetical protein
MCKNELREEFTVLELLELIEQIRNEARLLKQFGDDRTKRSFEHKQGVLLTIEQADFIVSALSRLPKLLVVDLEIQPASLKAIKSVMATGRPKGLFISQSDKRCKKKTYLALDNLGKEPFLWEFDTIKEAEFWLINR